MNHLMRLFSFSTGLSHPAIQQLVIDFVKRIHVSEHSITLEGEQVSRLAYEYFWHGVVEAQKRQHALKHPKNISVYITHTAPLAIWASERLGKIRGQQEQFKRLRGDIHRVAQRTQDSKNSPEEFGAFVYDLKKDNVVNAFCLNVTKSMGEEMADFNHNYMLVTVDGMSYAFIWDIEVFNGRGTIHGCKIEFGDGVFEAHREEWHRLTRLLGDGSMLPECS